MEWIKLAMIEPTINMQEFKKDWLDGMSAYNLKEKYKLSSRQFRWLKDRIVARKKPKRKATGIQKRKYLHYDFNEPYISMNRGYYLLRKDKIYYGRYRTLEQAKYVKKRLVEEKWNKDKLNEIRDEINIEPLRSYDL